MSDLKHKIDILSEFLESELSDYSDFKYSIEKNNEDDMFDVTFTDGYGYNKGKQKTLTFEVIEDDVIKLCMHDDSDWWEEVNECSYTIKYFWIAFLGWEGWSDNH